MSAAYWWPNLSAYAAQTALLITVGLLLPRWMNLGRPETRLRYWQALLTLTLLLPFVQPWHTAATHSTGSTELAFRHGLAGLAGQTGIGMAKILELSAVFVVSIALTRLVWLAFGFHALARYRRMSTALPADSQSILELRNILASEAEILVSEQVAVPLTYGWKKPTILVPDSFPQLSLEAQKGILCHELLHVHRRDWPISVAEEILKSLFWFHPGVWVFVAQIRLSREQIVDLEVLRLTRAKKAYLEALCALATTRPSTAVGLAFLRRSQLLHRVRLMTGNAPPASSRPVLTAVALSVLLASTLAVSASLFPLVRPAETSIDSGLLPITIDDPVEETTEEPSLELAREPLKLDDSVVPPHALSKIQPRYPELARKDRTEGVVVLQMVIDVHGRVQDSTVVQSARSDLDLAAVEAVRQWRFEPATLDGKPIPVYYNLTINFRLS